MVLRDGEKGGGGGGGMEVVNSKPKWLHPKLKKSPPPSKHFCCINMERATRQNLQMEILAHFSFSGQLVSLPGIPFKYHFKMGWEKNLYKPLKENAVL